MLQQKPEFQYWRLIDNMKILILGDARHGKDTVADLISKHTGLTSLASSVAALDIFLFDTLRNKYNLKYNSVQEAYEDRVNHRDIYYNEICDFNKDDKTRLVREIQKRADIYTGLRSKEEVEQAIEEGLFDLIIGVNNPRKGREPLSSNTASAEMYSHVMIQNDGTLLDLEEKIMLLIARNHYNFRK